MGRHKQVGDPSKPKIRSRLCVREYMTKGSDGKVKRVLPPALLFSAMPPLEGFKLFLSLQPSLGVSLRGRPLKARHYEI
eukprot:12605426-Prorocentrum_lima.AAC.1